MRLRDAFVRLANRVTGDSGDENGLNVDRSRRTLLGAAGGSVFAAGALSGTAGAAESSELVDRRIAEDVTSEYRSMDAVRRTFDRYGDDMLAQLAEEGWLDDADASAIQGFDAEGDPLGSETDVTVDVLGIAGNSSLEKPKRVLTTTHDTAEGVIHLTVVPDDGQSTALFDPTGGEELSRDRAETLYGCDGTVVDTYTECGWEVCNECSEWPGWKYQRTEYYVTEYDENGDGNVDCSESTFNACKCSVGICW